MLIIHMGLTPLTYYTYLFFIGTGTGPDGPAMVARPFSAEVDDFVWSHFQTELTAVVKFGRVRTVYISAHAIMTYIQYG